MEKRILIFVNFTTLFLYVLLFATAPFWSHSALFYRNCIVSIFLVFISLYTLFRTKEQRIINQFVTLLVCSSYLILLGSVQYSIAGIIWTTIFLIYPILIFEFFGNFTFPEKERVFFTFRWSLILITILTSIFLVFRNVNPFLSLSGYISAFLFCSIFYFKNAKMQTVQQREFNRVLFLSFLISIAPIVLSFLYNFILMKNFDVSFLTNALLSFLIFPFTISFLLIKQYPMLLKPNFKIYTIMFIVSSLYTILFGTILYYFFHLSVLQIAMICFLVFSGVLLVYGLIDSFYKKDVLSYHTEHSRIEKNKIELLFQFDNSRFLRTIDDMLSAHLDNAYQIDNYFFLQYTKEKELIQLTGKKVDLHKIKKSELLDERNTMILGKMEYQTIKIFKNTRLLGVFCVECSQFIMMNDKKSDFQQLIEHITELLSYVSLHALNTENIELPKIKYPGYIAKSIDNHIEEINKSYATYLHDDLLQSLLALNNFVTLIKSNDTFKDMALQTIKNLIDDLRSKIFEIYPTNIHKLSLNESLDILKEDLNIKYPDFKINFLYQTQLFFSDTFKLLLYRIVSELIINAIKHSQGDCIKLRFYQTKKNIILEVNDNGIGLDKDKIESLSFNEKHFGLLSIKEKISNLDGKISFKNNEVGLLVKVVLPLRDKKEGSSNEENFINR